MDAPILDAQLLLPACSPAQRLSCWSRWALV